MSILQQFHTSFSPSKIGCVCGLFICEVSPAFRIHGFKVSEAKSELDCHGRTTPVPGHRARRYQRFVVREDKTLTDVLRLEYTGEPTTYRPCFVVEDSAAEPPIRE